MGAVMAAVKEEEVDSAAVKEEEVVDSAAVDSTVVAKEEEVMSFLYGTRWIRVRDDIT